jgi:hypothetical protein
MIECPVIGRLKLPARTITTRALAATVIGSASVPPIKYRSVFRHCSPPKRPSQLSAARQSPFS